VALGDGIDALCVGRGDFVTLSEKDGWMLSDAVAVAAGVMVAVIEALPDTLTEYETSWGVADADAVASDDADSSLPLNVGLSDSVAVGAASSVAVTGTDRLTDALAVTSGLNDSDSDPRDRDTENDAVASPLKLYDAEPTVTVGVAAPRTAASSSTRATAGSHAPGPAGPRGCIPAMVAASFRLLRLRKAGRTP
jgi:hypothetical protein